MSDIVQKLWGFCHTLRHDGIDYGDYIEQLTYLLFFKMAEERGGRGSERVRLGKSEKSFRHCSYGSLRRYSPEASRSWRIAWPTFSRRQHRALTIR